jgi:hypothetical protein
MFGHGWQKAEATVVAKEERPKLEGRVQEYNYLIDVQPPTGPAIRTKIHYSLHAPEGGFADPAVGDSFGVLCKEGSDKVKWDLDDPRVGMAEEKRARDARAAEFAAAEAAAPGTPPPPSAVAGPEVRTVIVGDAAGSSSVEDRLAKLEKLKRSGLLDDAAFRSAREALEGRR